MFHCIPMWFLGFWKLFIQLPVEFKENDQSYCWWFRNPQTTTWDGAKTLVNNRIQLPFPQLVSDHRISSTTNRNASHPSIKISIQGWLQGIGNDRQTSLRHGGFFGESSTIKMDASSLDYYSTESSNKTDVLRRKIAVHPMIQVESFLTSSVDWLHFSMNQLTSQKNKKIHMLSIFSNHVRSNDFPTNSITPDLSILHQISCLYSRWAPK